MAKTTKNATTKRRAGSKAVSPRKPKNTKSKSFRVSKEKSPFMTFRITNQTLYWLVLGVVVIAFTAWIMKLQYDIQAIYDNIDSTSQSTLDIPTTKVIKKH